MSSPSGEKDVRALYWRNAYEELVRQTGRDLNDGLGVDPRKAAPSPPVGQDRGGWRLIETAPEGSDNPVLLIGLYPTGSAWSDIYQSWRYEGAWVRWPHSFPPTHWMPLPRPPEREAP